MAVQSYRGLVAWQKAMDLVKAVYAAAKKVPKEELFGLSSQLKRAAVSVPSNIAEGQGRDSTKEFLHHLAIAYASLMEVETQIIISGDLNFLTNIEVKKLLQQTAEVGKLINGLPRFLFNKIRIS